VYPTTVLYFYCFILYSYSHHRDLLSFPTRRSSDLKHPAIILGKGSAYARSEAEVRELVTKTGIPFLPMSMTKGVVPDDSPSSARSEEHTSELQSRFDLVCRLLLEKKKQNTHMQSIE